MSRKPELYSRLFDLGLLEYGSYIPGNLVREIVGIEMPDYGTREEFTDASLKELSAVDQLRQVLINEGKFIAGTGSDYRILLPSENRVQADRYMTSADRKLRRAINLNRSTPKQGTSPSGRDQFSARLVMKRESIRQSIDRNKISSLN